jgi:hypothetical protein
MKYDFKRIKLDISELEYKINAFYASEFKGKKKQVKIRRNAICLGSDTSEHGTGIAVIHTDKTELTIHLRAKLPVDKNLDQEAALRMFIGKVKILEDEVVDILDDIGTSRNDTIIVLEDTFLGFGNPYVLKVLSRFGGVMLMGMAHLFNELKIIGPSGARSAIGFNTKTRKPVSKKETTKDLVMAFVKELTGITFEDNDICDAFVLALAGVTV